MAHYPAPTYEIKTILACDDKAQQRVKNENVFVYDMVPYPVQSLCVAPREQLIPSFTNEDNFFKGVAQEDTTIYQRYEAAASTKVFMLDITLVAGSRIIDNRQDYFDLLTSAFSYTQITGLKSRVKLYAGGVVVKDVIVDVLRNNRMILTDGKKFYQIEISRDSTNVKSSAAPTTDFILYTLPSTLTQTQDETLVMSFSVFRASFKGASPIT